MSNKELKKTQGAESVDPKILENLDLLLAFDVVKDEEHLNTLKDLEVIQDIVQMNED